MHIRTVRHVRPTSSPPHWKVTKQTVLKKRRERKKRSKERKKVKRNPPRLVYLPNKTFPRKTHTSDTRTIYRSAVLHIYNLWLYIYIRRQRKNSPSPAIRWLLIRGVESAVEAIPNFVLVPAPCAHSLYSLSLHPLLLPRRKKSPAAPDARLLPDDNRPPRDKSLARAL